MEIEYLETESLKIIYTVNVLESCLIPQTAVLNDCSVPSPTSYTFSPSHSLLMTFLPNLQRKLRHPPPQLPTGSICTQHLPALLLLSVDCLCSQGQLLDVGTRSLFGNSLVVQWLGFCAFTAKGVGSIPGPGRGAGD